LVKSIPKDVREFEIWHQRLGHAPAKRLYLTAQHTQGLPKISPTMISSIVRCRACDIAKLKKSSKGTPAVLDMPLLPGQQFHMDLGFIRGPSNLQAVVDRKEEAKLKVIYSRQGFTCYLLIIDRYSIYVGFPFENTSSPDSFDGNVSHCPWP
jgi:hypothetical protein